MGKTKSILNKAINKTTGYCWYIDYIDSNGYPHQTTVIAKSQRKAKKEFKSKVQDSIIKCISCV